MRISTNECKHCGADYKYQWSGNDIGLYGPGSDRVYCPTCKLAMVDALAKIPKLFEYRFVKVDNVGLDEVLEWERLYSEAHKLRMEMNPNQFPLIRRIFPGLWDAKTNEHSKSGEIVGEDGYVYRYFYWPSKPDEAVISVERRIDLTTGEAIGWRVDSNMKTQLAVDAYRAQISKLC